MLPVTLTRYFHDSRLTLESFDPSGNVLGVRIEKEIGPELGRIVFRDVSFISLPSSLPGEAMRAVPVAEVGGEFWSVCRAAHDWFEPDDVAFQIESQDGPVYYVVAKSLGYEIIS